MRTSFTCLNDAMCVSPSKAKITRKPFVVDVIVGYEMILGKTLDIDSNDEMKLSELVLHDKVNNKEC